MAELTAKQRLFVAYYLGESAGNATDAARRAGYRSPEDAGRRLVRKSPVSVAINAKLDQAALTADEILARLSEQATASIGDFIEVTEEGAYKIDLLKAKRGRKLGMLKRIKSGEFGVEITLHDPQKALELLGKYRGLWKDNLQVEHRAVTPHAIPEDDPRYADDDSAGSVEGDEHPPVEGVSQGDAPA